MSILYAVTNKRKLYEQSHSLDYKDQTHNKCDWNSHIFKLNQLAFVIWNHIYLFQLFPLCSVHRSWQERIWKFQDTSSYAKRVNAREQYRKVNLRKGKRMKLTEIQNSIALIQSTSSNNITSETHQYLFQIKVLQITRHLPLYSRICALFSLLCNLKQLNLINISETSIKIICQYCKQLNTLNLFFNYQYSYVSVERSSTTVINTDKIINFIISLPHLQQLLFSNDHYQYEFAADDCLKLLLENCKTLKHLSLLDMHLEKQLDISQEHCNVIQQLRISIDSELNIVLSTFSNLTHLHLINLDDFRIADLIPEFLPKLASLTFEHQHCWSNYSLSENDVQILCKLKNLEELNFNGVDFDDSVNLKDLVKLKSLTLGISCNSIIICLNDLIEFGINQQIECLNILVLTEHSFPDDFDILLQFPKLKQLILSPIGYFLLNLWIEENITNRYLECTQLQQIRKRCTDDEILNKPKLWTLDNLY